MFQDKEEAAFAVVPDALEDISHEVPPTWKREGVGKMYGTKIKRIPMAIPVVCHIHLLFIATVVLNFDSVTILSGSAHRSFALAPPQLKRLENGLNAITNYFRDVQPNSSENSCWLTLYLQ